MADTAYGFEKQLSGVSYDDAVEKTRSALQDEGFGVLTEIDVKATLKKKLDVDFRRYVILGACNPPLAYRAFQGEEHIGLLLPCNVVVQEKEDGTVVISALSPRAIFQLVENPQVEPVAREVEERLRRVLRAIA